MKHENETIHIAPGEIWVLSLDENPTTGYSWSIISSKGLDVSTAFKSSAEMGIVGAGGIREYRISSNEPGTYEFSTKYCRCWETTDCDRIVALKIIVGNTE